MVNEERQNKIIEFIQCNMGCKTEEVVRGVQEHMSRQTFYKNLFELTKNRVVRVEKPNKRDHLLYLNKKDPLVIVNDNLDRFEYGYFEFLQKVIKELEKPYSSVIYRSNMKEEQTGYVMFTPPDYHFQLFRFTLDVFQETVTQWLLDLSLELPQKVNRPEYLERINGLVLTRVSMMYSKLFEKISHVNEKHLKLKWNKKKIKDTTDFVYKEFSTVFIKLFGADENPTEPRETFEFFDFGNEYNELFRFRLI